MINALIDVAEARGYQVRWHRGGPKAAWLPARGVISLRLGMSDPATLCALAHELGHAHYGHPPGHYGPHEIQADRFAARLLVSPTEYATAENLYGPDIPRIASELGVTTHVIHTFQTLHERTAA